MTNEHLELDILELKKMVGEFVARINYETKVFENKINDKICLLNKKKPPSTQTNKVPTINPDVQPEAKFLSPKKVAQLLGVSTTKFYDLNKLPDFPKPRRPFG